MSGWQHNRLAWEPTAESLPCSRVERNGWIAGVTGVTAGGGLLGLLVTGFVGGVLREGLRWEPLLTAAPLVGGALSLFAFGVARLFQRRNLRLTYHYVECEEQGLLGEDKWREPLFSYRGIEAGYRHNDPSSDARSRSEHEIWLRHADPSKDVLLYRAHSPRHLEAACSHFARLLNLPLIDVPGDVAISTSESPIEPLPSAQQGLSQRVRLRRTPGGYCAIHKRVWGSWSSALGVILTGSLYLVTPTLLPQVSVEIPLAALLFFFACFLALFVTHVFSSEELWVTRQELRYQIRYPWGRQVRARLSSRGIRRIDVAGDPNRTHLPSALRIEGREGLILFGRYATAEDKDRLAGIIKTVLGSDPAKQSA